MQDWNDNGGMPVNLKESAAELGSNGQDYNKFYQS